jgi:hypothetical protein
MDEKMIFLSNQATLALFICWNKIRIKLDDGA